MSDKILCCAQMRLHLERGLMRYDERYDEYSIVIRTDDDVQVLQKVAFCPWSGDKLPEGCRNQWFDELEALGVDPLNDPIPEAYRTKQWREGR